MLLVALLAGGGCGQDRTWIAARDAGADAAQDAARAPEQAPDREGSALPGADPLEDWPLIPIGVESRQFSSFDRAGGNDDGFTGRYSSLYVGPGEYVIFDALGPGRLNTLWFTSGEGGNDPLNQGHIKFYFDDELEPRADSDSDLLFTGEVPGFPPELVFDNSRSSGGFVSFVPMLFARRLKITTSALPYFYNAQYDTFPADRSLESWSTSTGASELERRFGAVLRGELEADRATEEQVVPLDYTHQGAGTLESVRLELDPAQLPDLHAARIQITWDDQTTPAVDCPLDMFFGSGLGLAPVRALGFTMDVPTATLENRFPMPFWSGFRLELSGVTGQLSVRIAPARYPAGSAGHFHASFARENPPAQGKDFQYLERGGAGKLVGTVLTVKPADPAADKFWWEGDLRSYENQRRSPSIHGTGHEDDHLGGWSNGFFSRPFTLPMNGEPASEILDRNRVYNGNVSMYRLWPGIAFASGVRHSVEHGRQNNRYADYFATTFFYAQDASWLVESDALRVCDAESRAQHQLVASGEGATEELDSTFEGRADRVGFSACHQSHSGDAEFQLDVEAQNRGVYLRRLYDQLQPQQRAQISVDGEAVGEWYVVESNRSARWSERDYFLPSRYTQGKTRLAIRISPAPGAPAWDAAEYRALSLTPPP